LAVAVHISVISICYCQGVLACIIHHQNLTVRVSKDGADRPRVTVESVRRLLSDGLRGPFATFVDWRQCAAVMQREAVTVMPSSSGGVT
jgi:hypothetical protein